MLTGQNPSKKVVESSPAVDQLNEEVQVNPATRVTVSPTNRGGTRIWSAVSMIGVIVIIGIASAVALLTVGCEKTETASSTVTDASPVVSGLSLTNDNWGNVCSNPSGYKGAEVELVGRIFTAPETTEGAVAIQMFADSVNSSQNTIVYYYGHDANQFFSDDIIKVSGTVGDEFVGQNLMGGTLTVPTIMASSVVKTDATALIIGGKDVPVMQEQDQHGVVMIIDKMNLQNNATHVFFRIRNNQPDRNASFYSYNAKIQAGSRQFEIDSLKQYSFNNIPSDILPGVEAGGVLVFPPIDSSVPESGSIAVYLEARSDNYRLDFNPYVFNITW